MNHWWFTFCDSRITFAWREFLITWYKILTEKSIGQNCKKFKYLTNKLEGEKKIEIVCVKLENWFLIFYWQVFGTDAPNMSYPMLSNQQRPSK